MDQIQPLATQMPWMTVGGNHERDWPGSGDRFGAAYDSGGRPPPLGRAQPTALTTTVAAPGQVAVAADWLQAATRTR